MIPRHLLRAAAWAAVGAVLLALSACTSPAPVAAKPSHSASSAPSVTPTPVPPKAAKITVDGTQLVVIADDGDTLATIPYTTPLADAVSQLTTLIGAAPAAKVTPESQCSYSSNVDNWGDGLELSSPVDGPQLVVVRSDARTVGDGISVETPQGFGVGDSLAAFVAGTPSAVNDHDSEVWFDLDSKDNGAVAIANDAGSSILLLNAPVNRYQDC